MRLVTTPNCLGSRALWLRDNFVTVGDEVEKWSSASRLEHGQRGGKLRYRERLGPA